MVDVPDIPPNRSVPCLGYRRGVRWTDDLGAPPSKGIHMKTTQRRVAATALAVGIALAGASTADAAGATKNLRCFSDEGASCTVTKDGAHLVSGFNRGWGVCEREEAERKVALRR